MITVALDEASSRLGTLLEQVEDRGEVVLICRDDQPVAELRPTGRERLPLHPELSRVKFNENPAAPLDAEDWPETDS